MIQATIFGGHEGRLRNDKSIYLTLFGGCELTCPTLARQVLAERQIVHDIREFEGKPLISRVMDSDHRVDQLFLWHLGLVERGTPTSSVRPT